MLKVNRNNKNPIWQQLLDQSIHNITTGKWPPGELLPPSRELAVLVGVSRSTIQLVYEELFSRGYTVTNRRGGTRISEWGYKTDASRNVISQGPTMPKLPLLNTSVDQLKSWLRGKVNQNVEIDFLPMSHIWTSLFGKIGDNHFYKHHQKGT